MFKINLKSQNKFNLNNFFTPSHKATFTTDAVVIFVACLGMMTGCGSVKVRYPSPTLKDPQVAGKSSRLHGGIAVTQGQWVTAIADASARPPLLTQSVDSTYNSAQMLTNFGIGRRFEVGFEFGTIPYPISPVILNVRWQVFGPSLSDPVNDGDMSLGFSLGYSNFSTSSSGDQKDTFGVGGYTWRGDASLYITETGASFGYHFDKNSLLYVGVSGHSMSLSGSVKHDRSTTGDSPAAEYKVGPKTGWATAPGIGVRFGEKVTFAMNVQYLTADWFGAGTSKGQVIGSINLGFRSGGNETKVTETKVAAETTVAP